MKDNLFEFLLSLFEKTLSQLKEKKQILVPSSDVVDDGDSSKDVRKVGVEIQIFKEASQNATRVFTFDERFKFTKASYQFLMRMLSLGLISSKTLELVINRLLFSDSRFISLQETKWTIRNTLEPKLSSEQMAFLELVLYCQEDGVVIH